ncbi:E3 ubiquitin-protein ligase MARCHF4-like [Tubulanus polymorphus]|uniref:E3 ubiquitin-protein ligase MARCHF4-like n=1 Tax=Tubulanus polymorphus TaxID=672921 RepID=UPI003DA6C581
MDLEAQEISPGPHCPMIPEQPTVHNDEASSLHSHSTQQLQSASGSYKYELCNNGEDEVLRISAITNVNVKQHQYTSEFESYESLDAVIRNKHLNINVPPPMEGDSMSNIYPICRICHQTGDEQEILISPCRCAGSLQYIHYGCLMKWLEVSTRKTRKAPKCELCHYQYHRHKKFKFHHWRLPRITKRDKILHIVFLINLIVMISCAVATVMCFLSDKGRISKFPRDKVDLTPEEIITLSCGVLFFLSFFIAMTVQIKAKHTIYQLFVKCIVQNMEWEIDEYDKTKDDLYVKQQQPQPPVYI